MISNACFPDAVLMLRTKSPADCERQIRVMVPYTSAWISAEVSAARSGSSSQTAVGACMGCRVRLRNRAHQCAGETRRRTGSGAGPVRVCSLTGDTTLSAMADERKRHNARFGNA